MSYENDNESGDGELTCPECGESMDGFELYTENAGTEGDSKCLYCCAPVPDEDWIRS